MFHIYYVTTMFKLNHSNLSHALNISLYLCTFANDSYTHTCKCKFVYKVDEIWLKSLCKDYIIITVVELSN